MPTIFRALKSAVNASLAPFGVAVRRLDNTADHDWNDTANYIPFERTLHSALVAGLSVGDYVDGVMNKTPGSSQSTLDKIASIGVFSRPLDTIVEIGPGTGRYLEKTLKAARPSRYEIYETAGPWAAYLVSEYKAILQPTDGYSLSATGDACADLVHAHKVFSTVPFMVTCCYWLEMVRVIRPGGWAVFDVVTERCLGNDTVEAWAKSGIRNGSYPAVLPRSVVASFFLQHGFTLSEGFLVPMKPGTTELLIFQKAGSV
jgi:hypothetical protein